MLSRCCLILALCLSASSWAHAAPEKADAGETPGAAFTRLYREWKTMVAKLTQIKQRYGSDPDADKKGLEAEFEKQLTAVKALDKKLAQAAEKAYLDAPNKDQDQNEYLFAYLTGIIQSDDLDKGAKLATVLREHEFEHKFFNLLAGVAYFGSNDFEQAEKYLKLASEAGEFSAPGVGQIGKQSLEFIEKRGYKELWKKEQAICAKEAKAKDLPKVKLTTTKGDIVVELFENEAPIATASFLSLVEKKFYDGLKFHRVLPGFMAQGGDPKGDGSGGPGYTIPDECFQDNHRNHFRGSLSMAHTSQRDTGGSQFFLTFAPQSTLDGQYTVFGRIVEGDDVLAKLQRCQPGDSSPPDKILKAVVLSKRDHKYDFVKKPDKK